MRWLKQLFSQAPELLELLYAQRKGERCEQSKPP